MDNFQRVNNTTDVREDLSFRSLAVALARADPVIRAPRMLSRARRSAAAAAAPEHNARVPMTATATAGEQLHTKLTTRGIPPWLDPLTMECGNVNARSRLGGEHSFGAVRQPSAL